MRIIDIHTHVYPDKIALKAAAAIGEFYGVEMKHDGTVGSLLASGARSGVSVHVIHSVATIPAQVVSINNYIAQTVIDHPGVFIGFATLHPDMDDPAAEVERVIGLGFKGVKLHPDFQRFNIDDPRCDHLYAAIAGRLPLLFHTGDSRHDYSAPRRIPGLLDRFPALEVICAHFGGYTEWDEAKRCLGGRRVWVDTSSSLAFIGVQKAMELIEFFGEDRVLFGSDYPMWDAGDEIAMFKQAGMSEATMRKIFYGNAARLLRIDDVITDDNV